MKTTVIACGAGATKAAIEAVQRGVISKNKLRIINTTSKDIPNDYNDRAIILGDGYGGCGKERTTGIQLAVEYIQENMNNIDSLISEEDDFVTIIGTLEGGTGSGSSSVFADYFRTMLPVHLMMISGFEDDVQGLDNTIGYLKELSKEYTISWIQNKKFLPETDGDKLAAEKLANEYIAKHLEIILGNKLVGSYQNIDNTDHYKLVTNSGLIVAEYRPLNRVKNLKEFNAITKEMIDDTKSVDFVPSAIKVGMFINATRSTFDSEYPEAKKALCGDVVGESYLHIQQESGDEWVAIIGSGTNLPTEEVSELTAKYNEAIGKINKRNDDSNDFFNTIKSASTGLHIRNNVTEEVEEERFSKFKNVKADETIMARNRGGRRRRNTGNELVNANTNITTSADAMISDNPPRNSKFTTSDSSTYVVEK